MDAIERTIPLLVIVGPTASGKSSVAMEIARRQSGEIICADSRTIYKGMDIGTAKPSPSDRQEIPHHGLDLVEPGEVFTAADFKRYAKQKIQEVRDRGNLPILVGGTGLYIDGVVLDYQFGSPKQPSKRQFLNSMSLQELHDYCEKHNVTLPKDSQNKRRVIRAIEQQGISTKRLEEPDQYTIVVGISTEKSELRERIRERAHQLFNQGMVDEAVRLGDKYGWDSEAMTGNIYKLTKQYLDGKLSKQQLQEKFIIADWRLAKRQLTWLKRNSFIDWVPLDEAIDYIEQKLADY